MTEKTKQLRTVEGRVVSNKMNKTVTVLVERQVKRRSDARNAMVSALRQVLHPLGKWPIAARPSTDPNILHTD
jgi:hypothetical protein